MINLNKPQYVSSRQAVNSIQELAMPMKAGHAGTLDPLATGVLIVCIGTATKLVQYIQDQPKEYIATFLLGKRSNTDDITGEISEADNLQPICREQIEELLPRFRGQVEQVPPLYSAVHVQGKRAYKLARTGKQFAIAARTVEIYHLEIVEYRFPELIMRIECGSGTYIRSLGRDLGELLGCGAVMSDLVRTRIGPFRLEEAVELDDLATDSWQGHLIPPAVAVDHLPKYQCTAEECIIIKHGVPVAVSGENSYQPDTTIAILTPQNQLACLAEYQAAEQRLQPRVVYLDQK